MSDKYDDMKPLSRPVHSEFPPMPMQDRAAQFSPFEALVGYDSAVEEAERLTEKRPELTEDEKAELDERFAQLMEMLPQKPLVTATHFIEDSLKAGGRFEIKAGAVRTFDSAARALVFADGERILLSDIYTLDIDKA